MRSRQRFPPAAQFRCLLLFVLAGTCILACVDGDLDSNDRHAAATDAVDSDLRDVEESDLVENDLAVR